MIPCALLLPKAAVDYAVQSKPVVTASVEVVVAERTLVNGTVGPGEGPMPFLFGGLGLKV